MPRASAKEARVDAVSKDGRGSECMLAKCTGANGQGHLRHPRWHSVTSASLAQGLHLLLLLLVVQGQRRGLTGRCMASALLGSGIPRHSFAEATGGSCE